MADLHLQSYGLDLVLVGEKSRGRHPAHDDHGNAVVVPVHLPEPGLDVVLMLLLNDQPIERR